MHIEFHMGDIKLFQVSFEMWKKLVARDARTRDTPFFSEISLPNWDNCIWFLIWNNILIHDWRFSPRTWYKVPLSQWFVLPRQKSYPSEKCTHNVTEQVPYSPSSTNSQPIALLKKRAVFCEVYIFQSLIFIFVCIYTTVFGCRAQSCLHV